MTKARNCFCCAEEYKYCPNCQGYNPNETWRFLFHDENCKAVYEIWNAVKANQMSKDDAKAALSAMNTDKVVKSDTMVAKDVREILGIKEEVKQPENKEEAVTEKKESFQNKQFQNKRQDNNKDKKF